MTISEISLQHYLVLSSLLFAIGVSGLFMNRKNVITILMSIELMLLAVNINFVAFSVSLQDIVGQVFSIIVLSIAAAEVSIGLAILVLYYRNRDSIEIEDINQMRG
jgi:NADH-quinone oxidoreductase subunit K